MQPSGRVASAHAGFDGLRRADARRWTRYRAIRMRVLITRGALNRFTDHETAGRGAPEVLYHRVRYQETDPCTD